MRQPFPEDRTPSKVRAPISPHPWGPHLCAARVLGAALAVILVLLTSSGWGLWGSAALSPCGYSEASWGTLWGSLSPCLLITSGDLAQHSVLLAALREAGIVPAPLGCGDAWGEPSLGCCPSTPSRQASLQGCMWRSCCLAGLQHGLLHSHCSDGVDPGCKMGGTEGCSAVPGAPQPTTFLALVCGSERSQKSPCAPVLLLPLSLP